MAAGKRARNELKPENRLLFRAAVADDVDGIKDAFKSGASINARNMIGMRALDEAARYGCGRAVQALLRLGSDPSAPRSAGFLHAAARGYTEIYRDLIAAGVRQGQCDKALCLAASNNDVATINLLKASGAHGTTVYKLPQSAPGSAYDHAIDAGNVEALRALLATNLSEEQNQTEREAVYRALDLRKPHMASEIIEAQPDMVSKDIFERALDPAPGISRAMLRRGLDPDSLVDEHIPLLVVAAHSRNPDIVDDLLNRGARIDVRSGDGWNALHGLAYGCSLVRNGNGFDPDAVVRIAYRLLDAGVSADDRSTEDETPLEVFDEAGIHEAIEAVHRFREMAQSRTQTAVFDEEARQPQSGMTPF